MSVDQPASEVSPAPEAVTVPASVGLCRAAGTVVAVLGLVGMILWLWTSVRSQVHDAFFLSASEGDWADRVDVTAFNFPLVVESAVAVGVGLLMRLAADTAELRVRDAGYPITELGPARRAFGPLSVGWALAVALVAVTAVLAALVGSESDDASRVTLGSSFDAGTANDDPGDRSFDASESESEPQSESAPDAVDDPSPWYDIDDLVVPDASTTTRPEPEPQPSETLTVHTDGCGVIRTDNNEGTLDLTWVVSDLDGFQVLGRNANGETRYRYYQSGTYTVVLETYGTDSYVPVSNTVTINC